MMSDTVPYKAWLVFSDKTEIPYLRILKRGFRHCFAVLHDGDHLILFDPMAHYTAIDIEAAPKEFDPAHYLEEQGYTVTKVSAVACPRRPAPVMLHTCVEACKRLLGIHKRFIFTPWQLYRHILKAQNN